MTDIIDFRTGSSLKSADEFLEEQKGKFRWLMVIGLDEDDDPIFGANGMSARDAVYLLELIKLDILENWVDG